MASVVRDETHQAEHDRLIAPGHDFGSVTDTISKIVLQRKTPVGWWFGFAVAFLLLQLLLVTTAALLFVGVGIWGIRIPVAWGFAILNFVWWIGIGHAGTLISAILLLLRQEWRTSINRFAEAMTLFAVACAAYFPVFHTGRPWLAAYWLFPYPNTMGLWPNFRSPLIWDVFAVSTYATVSALFWFVGLIPDLATLRDRARSKPFKIVYGMLAMGWRGSARHWHNYETAYLLLAGLATPLVVSVHTVVSLDFTVAIVPGWHATIFAPYFVAGAIFSGFAMVLTVMIPVRRIFGLEAYITEYHFENMARFLLLTSIIVGYAYLAEYFMAWYSGVETEQTAFWKRAFGPYWISTWVMISCNAIFPQILWFKKARTSVPVLFVLSMLINVGMWFERYVIIIGGLSREYDPAVWGVYTVSWPELVIVAGSFGFFCQFFLIFLKLFPVVAIAEVKEIEIHAKAHHAVEGH
jgi:Ni/Fe-hydrogenase subunit HybB-like protein